MMLMPCPHLSALPIRIVKPLRDKTVLARHKATLECTVSHARGRVRWLRGDTEIFAGDKYEICNLDCYRTLIIHHVGPEDEDSYTCDAFDDRSTARLLVEGEWAPRQAPLVGASVDVPGSEKTPESMSLSLTACKSLSAGLEGAGWIQGQGSVSPCMNHLGSPPVLAMPQLTLDSHCSHRELEARMRFSGPACRLMHATAERWGHAPPGMERHTDTIPSLRALH